ncbi:glycosyltransferase [Mycobacterium paraterrae]|uniref:Glycosyltransferase n=1 Tax=Mycobacterium paraterrae TaxID=577492 RepID=A0ABY3VHW5_9MYCO|nr:glycosyltransferase [Mycobacterium paraterrae]UMB69015.1 glycosyltransferase [Mycobacterium paraterrae]
MIVRNEAHIVQETLDSVAPFVSYWVIVDTGSTDGTQSLINSHMAKLGIRGELHERPWHNFGENRSEALTLAQGHANYIWVIDADDVLVGAPDFTELSADGYTLRYHADDAIFWRPQLFRDGLQWCYEGAVHENPRGDPSYVSKPLMGDYYIHARCLGARSRDPKRHQRDRDLLLADLDRNPNDVRAMSHLARNYFGTGDFESARKWCTRQVEHGGASEATYHARFLLAESMSRLGDPWPDILDAYLRAWECRPTRAEPLHAVAVHCREQGRYQLGYHFAERAARIPLPEGDSLVESRAVYDWRITDELAICASWIGKHSEAFRLCRELLARSDIPDEDRQRIAQNRDFSVPPMIEAASQYANPLTARQIDNDADVTISVQAGLGREATQLTLDSFLNCCIDLSRVGRIVVFDHSELSNSDRGILQDHYPLLEFAPGTPHDRLGLIRQRACGRFWLHLGQGWRFFASDDFITRLTAVLDAEPNVFQVGINWGDATGLTGRCAAEECVRRATGTGRYVIDKLPANGPAMFDLARLESAVGLDGQSTVIAGLHTATLDEILCILAA